VEGRFLRADDVSLLRQQAMEAEEDGTGAIVVSDGSLGDPFVQAAALSAFVRHALVGVRVALLDGERHPTMLARECTALDLLCGGRSVLCFGPPFTDLEGLEEALALCRAMWRHGKAIGPGPRYPVPDAVNRPQPATATSPRLALDLTGPEAGGAAGLAGAVDLVLRPTGRADFCLLEPV
jgi:alkanesulfonate monooxygenase SsuD/methylene tetrahydromethanopterin reductase-like flavin-dependent oxidoreductase (luciferase family)